MTDRSDAECLNCGARLAGPYCHACGQPVKGMIRQFRSIVGDILDTLFEYDSRIWRTLVPLYFLPGRVTGDFIAGRRNRYVTPFRLAFVATVVAFLVLQMQVSPEGPAIHRIEQFRAVAQAETVADVIVARDEALQSLAQAEAAAVDDESAAGLEAARRALAETAQRRIEQLEAAGRARPDGAPPAAQPERLVVTPFGRLDWDVDADPIEIGWLPEGLNRRINDWAARGVENVERALQDPGRYIDAFLGLLPAVLFVLMPVFALLLKIFYVTSGRLYMEHMVVTLHSQSFLAIALTLHGALDSLAVWLPAGYGVKGVTDFVAGVALAWVPLYILLMQKRVYAQGWTLTLTKFVLLGVIYLALVIAGVGVAALVTLVRGA